ncbi:biotin transporter BioY [Mangrovibacillus cuniculi]|uniref:Biotin transporter n=1 Tax=Mangrovibacillus cuniculi TaxID=2593652 RepID=A0A7S8CAP9_9BACI|nr:biotin transporter BioY [Mangrovibacillus cuniculi]QPC46509.1 biotin transporter BioY [Mangrovibacillus cuniculi]
MKLKAIDLTLCAMFAALMAIGANVTSFLVVGGVPITLTTFFCILAGLILGSRLGALSMLVYALVGFVGAPVFAGFTGGPSIFIKPTFGFILSYILVAYVVGKMVERNNSKTTIFVAAFVGFIINYVFGTNWMYAAYVLWAAAPEGFTYKMAWAWMVVPLPKDILLAAFAAVLAPRLTRTLSYTSSTMNKKTAA